MQLGQEKSKVLFVCTGNSCRSQMAEGWAQHLLGNQLEVYSAGLKAQGINPHAVYVMQEAGIDISKQESNSLDSFSDQHFDYVITVCDHARQHCPSFPGTTHLLHRRFDDPPFLAEAEETEVGALNHYRRVRDEIKDWVLENLGQTIR
ncbi:MAG: arsenate reductase [SAR324 cluster bacterium]|uniref:Arsenate reductase n=1 Tax=SAR324 cluster bacterium TaxID=2024889 RepID=A0A2A4T0A0_9DELT|nr:MAG: arsenate reductase [SAR324 cluster bacterium]